ncbi:MAG: hypothetical protein KDB88_06820 [Flavobacteriales bacterium]|nr:hypothetical protein [Flavobacteriales bacterium]
MLRQTFVLICFPLSLWTCSELHAQGCSDAGVCTAGPIGDPLLPDTGYRHSVALDLSYALGEQGVRVFQVVPEIRLGLTDRLGFQVKMPYTSVSGNLGSNNGAGDVTTSLTYQLVRKENSSLTALIGAKLPTGRANDSISDGPLPMPYQTTLGTTDLLLGLNYRLKKLSLALAYQHVLFDANENGFLRNFWPDNVDAQSYFESFYLTRGNDLVFRTQYSFKVGSIDLSPGILAIYRINEDSIVDSTYTRVNVDGSSGLTLNLTLNGQIPVNDRTSIHVSYGSPLLVRETRPDGLTRSMVLSAGVRWRF